MRSMRAVILGAVFLIGCAVGGAASQLVVPPVRAGTNPTRWEYFVLQDPEKILSQSNQLGAKGWEMVGMTGIRHATDQTEWVWFFKRPLP
jgi:hypothetical protein